MLMFNWLKSLFVFQNVRAGSKRRRGVSRLNDRPRVAAAIYRTRASRRQPAGFDVSPIELLEDRCLLAADITVYAHDSGNPFDDNDNFRDSGGFDRLHFSTRAENDGTDTQQLTVKNDGDETLTGLTISIGGDNSDQYSLSVTTLPDIAPAAEETFTITFEPTKTGRLNGELSIGSNDPDENPFDILMRADGVTLPPSTLVVNSASTDNDSIEDLSNLTLVAALELANASTDVSTITFSSALNGVPIVQPRDGDAFRVGTPMNIVGNGAPATIIQGNNSEVFQINDNDNVSYDVSISGVTIQNGTRGISNNVDLTITDSLITNNTLSGGGGGGILSSRDLTLVGTTVSGNAANNGDGGGIFSNGGTVTLTNSTVSGNSANAGGGVYARDGLTILNSTIVDNTAITAGGIQNDNGTLTIDNTIVAGNEVVDDLASPTTQTPSDIVVQGGSLASGSSNNLISDPATAGGLLHGTDGNILGDGTGGALSLSFIVDALGNNGGATPTHALASGSVAIDAGSNTAAVALTEDQRQATPRNNNGTVDIGAVESGAVTPPAEISVSQPVGTELTDNSGTVAFGLSATGQNTTLTFTVFNAGLSDLTGISVSSSGTDAGDFTVDTGSTDTTVSPLTLTTFTVTFSPTVAGSKTATIEIASSDADENPFEIAITGRAINPPAATLLVDAAGDVDNGNFETGDLTLREAIVLANLVDDATTITFATGLNATSIDLTTPLDVVTQPLTITGNGPAETIIDAKEFGSVLTFDDGDSGGQIAVSVTDVTLTGGKTAAGGSGGGISNAENLTVRRSAIVGNTSVAGTGDGLPAFGGGVYSSGTLLIDASTVSGNTAEQLGGGVISTGLATITNSTISSNSAGAGIGGFGAVALGSAAPATILSSTIVNNTATTNPFATFGGLSSFGAALTLHNTIVAGNVEVGVARDIALAGDPAGTFAAATNNLIGDPASAGGLIQGTDGNILGDGAGTLLALASIVGDLADNGGPTFTHALADNSPALDVGSNSAASALTQDQRGEDRVSNTTVDIGAVEFNVSDTRSDETVALSAGAGETSIQVENDELVVTQGGGELLRISLATLNSLTIDGTDGDDSIAITGPGSGFDGDLIVNGGDGTDSVSFTAPVNAGDGDVSVTAEAISISQTISTTGDQTFAGPVVLTGDVTLTGGTVTFDATVNSASGENNALTVTGNAEFGDAIGTTDALSTLTISQTTTLASGDVETTGAQTFTGSVTVESGATVEVAPGGPTNGVVATGGLNVAAGATLQIDVAGTTPGTEHGQVQVTGSVDVTGSTLAIDSTTTIAVGDEIVLISNDGSDAVVGTFDGIAEGDTIQANGQQLVVSYVGGDGNDVTLSNPIASVDLASGGGDAVVSVDGSDIVVTQGGTEILRAPLADATEIQINGSDGDDNITVSGPGSNFNGDLIINPGDGTDTVTLDGAVDVGDGNVEVTAESIIIGGDITTTGNQTFTGASVIADDVTLAAALVTFTSTVNSASGENNSLDVTGNAEFEGAIGGTDALSTLSVSGTTTLSNGAVETTGAQTFTGAVTIPSGATFSITPGAANGVVAAGGLTLDTGASLAVGVNGTTPGTEHGQVDVTGAVDVTGSTLVVNSTTTVSFGDEIVLVSNDDTDAVVGTFDGIAEGDTIEVNGQQLVVSYVGGDGNDITLSNPIASVDLASGGGDAVVSIDGADIVVTQGGTEVLRAPLADATEIQINGSDGDDNITVSGPASNFNGDLIINPGAGTDTVTIDDAVDVDDGDVEVTAESIIIGGDITTSGNQTFTGAVVISDDVTLTAATATFTANVNSASAENNNLDIDGNAVFGDAVGNTEPLGTLDVSEDATIETGTLTTTGAQTLAGTVTLESGASLSATPGDVNGGVLATGGLTLESGGALTVAINGSTAGTGHGQVDVTGAVDVTDGTLSVSSTATLALGDEIVLINNDGSDAVIGTFDGLPEGSTIELNGQTLTLSYAGGDGNDVTLTNSTATAGLTSGGGDADVSVDGTDIVVTQDGNEVLRVPLADVGTLRIDGSDGDDNITITGPSSGFDGNLVIDNGDGTDTVTFANPVDVGSGDVDVTAETIILGANITTTGAQTFNGNTILNTDVTLTGATVTFNSQLDSASGETFSLTVDGDAVFNAEVGDTVLLDEIEVTGDTTVAATISTNGARTFGGSVRFPSGGEWLSLPGDPDGGILDMGGLDADAGSTLNFPIDSPTAGTGHGQFNVTGTVDVTGATLNPFASGTPALGEYVLINNDSNDAVVGTFDGLPEGATVTVQGHPLRLSYVGGDGNDVVLVNETIVTSVPSSADATQVTADGDDIVVTQGGIEISRTPIASASRIEVQGSSGNDDLALASLPASATGDVVVDAGEGDDTLTVDLRDGNPAPGGVVIFDGGVGGNDSLIVIDETGTPTTIDGAYFPDAQTFGDGEITFNLAGGGTLTVQFTGLEPTEISGIATTTLTTPNGVDVISIDAATGSGSEPAIVTSGTSGGVGFESLTLFDVADYTIDLAANDAAGTADDSVTINSLAAQGVDSLTINTGSEGSDTVDLAAALTISGGLTVNGAVISGDGSLAGPLTVGSGSRLAPGNAGVDDLAIGNLSAGSGAELEFTFSGTEADQLQVTGAVDITDAALVTTGTADASTDFVLINNDGTDAVTGTFASLTEGAAVTIDGESFEITYVGGDGNDVVLLAAEQTATIQGQYYVDANGNGQFDDGLDWYENGVTIQLLDNTGTVVATQVTQALDIDGESGDEVGAYQFADVAAGAYVVRQVLPTGAVQTVPDFPTTLNGDGTVSGSWDYDDDDGNSTPGPANWNTVASTVDGFFQSPIDISGVPSVDLSSVLDISYEGTTLERLFNNGHGIEVEFPAEHGNSISIGHQDQAFEILQFHFHTTSEHEVDGTGSDMELHLVHQHADGGLAVIGLLLEADESAADNAALAPLFDAFPSIPDNGDEVTITDPIDMNAILPASHDGWYYEGSLTTPPGSQGVNWFVFETPVTISTSQLAAYQAVANHDASHDFDPGNRPVQPLNGRQLNEQNHEVTAEGGESYSLNFATAPPSPVIVVGNESSSGSIARTVDPTTGEEVIRTRPFGGFAGEIRTATGDVNLDGTNDIIVAPGPGGGPRIQVLDGVTGETLQDFYAYHPAFTGGVFVAAGDVDNDGDVDIITSPDAGGGPHIRAFDAATGELVQEFFAFNRAFTGGVRVAAGDINGDGYSDIITANGPGAAANVRVFSGADGSVLQSFVAYPAGFLGGAYVAAGDINGDGLADVITGAGAGGGPHVRGFSGEDSSQIADFFAYSTSDTAGVRVSASDVTGDGLADILVNPATASSNQPRGFDAGNEFAPTSGGLDVSSLGQGFYSSAVSLRAAPSNVAPELANEIRDQTATTGTSFDFTVPADTFRDRDRDDLTFTATLDDTNPLPSWLTFNASTQVFSGTPVAPGDVGTIIVRVTADDSISGTASDDFQITVRDASVAPTGSNLIALGAQAGQAPLVQVIDSSDGSVVHEFFAYNPVFRGGVDVALADVNDDGVDDIITGAGPGGGPHVKVFDGTDASTIASFFPYAVAFTGGVRVAGGDVNGDGHADIITGAGAGGSPLVKAFSGDDLSVLHSFFAFAPGFAGGVDVAAGDVTGDGNADIVTAAGAGGGPHVRVFDGTNGSQVSEFFAFSRGFTGGVSLSTADTNGDGFADVIAGQASNGGEARIFDGRSAERLGSFSPFGGSYNDGLNIGSTNYDGDTYEDVIAAKRSGSGPHVQVHSGNGLNELDDFFAFDPGFIGGALVD